MPFGLSNAPAAFQRYMNEILADMLDVWVIGYLDDMNQHKAHIKKVLRRLRKNGLYASPPKCEWHKDEVEYLSYILTTEGLRMDKNKIQTVLDWPEPRKVKDVQSFLGFCNFYCQFIFGYSDIVIPLTRLTCKNTSWNFDKNCCTAFEKLKEEFTHAPVLTHWVPDAQIIVESDASDYALTAIFSIHTTDGDIHPVAFHSRSFNSAELNYNTHDKELLAIFEAFKHWRQYLEGSGHPIDVVTNHKNLEYFSTTKLLTHQQARWSEFLSQFNMVIRFHPGKLGAKPDSLTRRWDIYRKGGNSDFASVNPSNMKPIFTHEQFKASLRATYLATPIICNAIIMDMEKLHKDIWTSLPNDPISATHFPVPNAPNWTINESGLLQQYDRIYVPDSADLRLKVIQY